MSTSSVFAATDVFIDKDETLKIERLDTNYIVTGDGFTITNTAGPRHTINSCIIDLGNHTGTKLVSSVTVPVENDPYPFFGFDGIQFKGDSVDADITISKTDTATPIAIMGGFTVDGCKVIFDKAENFLWSGARGSIAQINVKNGGYLDFKVPYIYSIRADDKDDRYVLYTSTPVFKDTTTTPPTTTNNKYVAFNVEKGSTLVANMGVGTYILNASTFAGKTNITTKDIKLSCRACHIECHIVFCSF